MTHYDIIQTVVLCIQ